MGKELKKNTESLKVMKFKYLKNVSEKKINRQFLHKKKKNSKN
jgi:hypothetical protein